jgi:hypothetical protein
MALAVFVGGTRLIDNAGSRSREKEFDFFSVGKWNCRLSFALKVAPHGRWRSSRKNRAESNTNYAQGESRQ